MKVVFFSAWVNIFAWRGVELLIDSSEFLTWGRGCLFFVLDGFGGCFILVLDPDCSRECCVISAVKPIFVWF